VEQWSARKNKSASINLAGILDSELVHLLQDPFFVQYSNNSFRDPSSSRGPIPLCKDIKSFSFRLFNAPTIMVCDNDLE
jgi:hypothetical protein